MHFFKPLPEGRKSYSVPKQELKSTRCFTTLDVKRAMSEIACDSALDKLRYDLARQLIKVGFKVPVSTENKFSGNWVALVMPDAIASRLGLMTRIASLMTMNSEADHGSAVKHSTRDTLSQSFTKDLSETLPVTLDCRQSSERRYSASVHQTIYGTIFEDLIKPVLYDLLSTDRDKGLELLHAWRDHNHKYSTAFSVIGSSTSLNDYIHNSAHIFPGNPWMSTLHYALGLHLEDIKLEAVEPAITAAMQSVTLTRDYWAWPRDSCSTNNVKRINNAVAVSMVERQCSEAQAMVAVKNAAIAAESKFLGCKRDLLEAMGEDHSEVVMFLDAVEHFAAGNSLWCSSCPLYHGRR
jgi:hypothetical protein